MTGVAPNPTQVERDETASDRQARQLQRLANLQTLVVVLFVAFGVLWLLSDVVLLLFAAILLACQLFGAAKFVSRWTRAPYPLALLVVVALLTGTTGVFLWLRGPELVREGQLVASESQQQITALWSSLGNVAWAQGAISRVQSYVSHIHIAGYAAGVVTSTLGSLGSLLLILVAAVYLASSPHTYIAGVLAVVPRAWYRHTYDVLQAEGATLRWWFVGQLIDMAVIGVLSGIGLFLLGVKLAVALGLIAALCNFVPYIGALAGSLPAVFVAFSQSPRTAVYVALLFVAVQTLEGNVVAPLIQRRTVNLPPVVTLLSQTVLGTLFGPFGLILATPITAAGLLLVKTIRDDVRERGPTSPH